MCQSIYCMCQSSAVCVMCSRLMFPYLVCFLSSLSVIISSFLSSCVCLLFGVFIVLSVQYDIVWSTRYSLVFLSVSALPCPALTCSSTLKTVILSFILVCVFLVRPSCVHRNSMFVFYFLCITFNYIIHNNYPILNLYISI